MAVYQSDIVCYLLAISRILFLQIVEISYFYVLGIYTASYFPVIKKQLSNRGAVVLFFMLANAVVVISVGDDIRAGLLTALLGSISMLYLAIRIDEGNSKVKSFLELASKYSYGIYLMSPYVQVAVRVFLYQKAGMPYLLCMGLMLVLGFLIPYVIIKYIVEKNVYLRRILIGEW